MRDHEIKALQATLERIADSLEHIAARPVLIDGTNNDTDELLNFLVTDYDPKKRPWQFLVNIRKQDTERERLLELIDAKMATILEAIEEDQPDIVDVPLPDEEVGWDGGPQTLGHDVYEEGDSLPEDECVDVSAARRES